MKIGIIVHPYDEVKPSGLGRYVFELVNNMLKCDTENEHVLFLKNKPSVLPSFPGTNWRVVVGEGGMFWIDNVLKKEKSVDVHLFCTPVMPFFFKPKKSVVIALDFAYKKLRAPSLKYWIQSKFTFWYHQLSMKRAWRVVASSYATKNDCIRLFGIAEEKIKVIHMGFTRICKLPHTVVDVPSRYFFFIGQIKKRKNVLNLVKAFILFKEQTGSEHKLLIAGNNSGEYYEEVCAYIAEKGMEKYIDFLGYISDSEAAFVHTHAEAFVFVTLVEGSFGMPVLEAMDCGTAVITSDTETSYELKETESALLVDPYSVKRIALGMERVASDEALREKLQKNGKAFADTISWEKMARDVVELVKCL